MRRTKECAEQTRLSIIAAAFDIFLEDGYEGSSLEKICRAASVTRGAAYWHFKNKRDLYRQTVATTLEQMDAVREAIASNPALDMEDRLVELLWSPHAYEEQFRFVGSALEFHRRNPEFSEIRAEIEQGEMRLYWFFLTELSKLDEPAVPVEELAVIFHTTFLGLYSYPTSSSVIKNMNRDMVRTFVRRMLASAA